MWKSSWCASEPKRLRSAVVRATDNTTTPSQTSALRSRANPPHHHKPPPPPTIISAALEDYRQVTEGLTWGRDPRGPGATEEASPEASEHPGLWLEGVGA
jgi:hypothetical protein